MFVVSALLNYFEKYKFSDYNIKKIQKFLYEGNKTTSSKVKYAIKPDMTKF